MEEVNPISGQDQMQVAVAKIVLFDDHVTAGFLHRCVLSLVVVGDQVGCWAEERI